MIFLLVRRNINFKSLFLCSFLGIATLSVLKIFENIFKMKIFINIISVSSALIFGPIGVIFNILINYVVF